MNAMGEVMIEALNEEHPVDAAADAHCAAIKAERQSKDALTVVLKEQEAIKARVLACDRDLAQASELVCQTGAKLQQAREADGLPTRLPAAEARSEGEDA